VTGPTGHTGPPGTTTLCGIFTCTSGTKTQTITSITGMTSTGVVILTYVRATNGEGHITNITPGTNQCVVTLNNNATNGDTLWWYAARLS